MYHCANCSYGECGCTCVDPGIMGDAGDIVTLHQGWLKKKTDYSNKFRQRYCVLQTNRKWRPESGSDVDNHPPDKAWLVYKNGIDSRLPRGIINLQEVISVGLSLTDSDGTCIDIVTTKNRIWTLKATTPEDCETWIDQIDRYVHSKKHQIQSIKEGFLQKEGQFVRTWKSRYFVLTPGLLWYFESEHDGQHFKRTAGYSEKIFEAALELAKGVLKLEGAKCKYKGGYRGRKHCFKLKAEGRTMHCEAESEDDGNCWADQIENVSRPYSRVSETMLESHAVSNKDFWQCSSCPMTNLASYQECRFCKAPNPMRKNDLLHNAAAEGNKHLLASLIRQDADCDSKSTEGNTPLFSAIQNIQIPCAKLLLEGHADPNIPGTDQMMPLELALNVAEATLVRLLIKHKANVQHISQDGSDSLMLGAAAGDLDVVECLLQNKCDVNNTNNAGMTALCFAVENYFYEIVELLLENKSDVNHKVKDTGWTPVMLSARYSHVDLVKLLVQREADVDHTDENGLSPLHIASTHGPVDAVQAILDHSAEINAITHHKNHSPLSMAVGASNHFIVEYLLQHKAAIDSRLRDGRTPLMIASEKNNPKIVDLLLYRKPDINLALEDGNTALSLAATNNSFHVMGKLLKSGANTSSQAGETPLIIASRLGHSEIVVELLNTNANVDDMDQDGLTALFHASKSGHSKVVATLISRNADVNKDFGSETCLSIALKEGYVRVVELLYLTGTDVIKEILGVKFLRNDDVSRATQMPSNKFRAKHKSNSIILKLSPSSGQKKWVELSLLATVPPNRNIPTIYGICLDFQVGYNAPRPALCVGDFGTTLEDVVARTGSQVTEATQPQFYDLILDMSGAISHLHQNCYIHRNISLTAFQRSRDFGVMLTEFDYAKRVSPSTETVIDDASVLPAWRWQAPETIRDRVTSIKSDIWMFGITVWQLLGSKRKPFYYVATDAQLLLSRLCGADEPINILFATRDIKFCPKFVRDLLQDCCRLLPAERPSIEHVTSEIQSKIKDQGHAYHPAVPTNLEMEHKHDGQNGIPDDTLSPLPSSEYEPRTPKSDAIAIDKSTDTILSSIASSDDTPLSVSLSSEAINHASIDYQILSFSNLELTDFQKISFDAYRARNNKVIVTVLCRTDSDNLWLEASILRTLPPNQYVCSLMGVLTDFSYGSNQSRPAIIVSQLGKTLKRYLTKKGHAILKSPDRLLHFALMIASSIAHVHKHGVIHRNLNLSSFHYYRQKDLVVLSEFRYARRIMGKEKVKETTPEIYLESQRWRFCAPETLQQSLSSKQSDVWMFGMCLWEMLHTRELPFEVECKSVADFVQLTKTHQKESFGDVLNKKSEDQTHSLALLALIDHCTRKAPEKRPEMFHIVTQLILVQQNITDSLDGIAL